MEMTLKNTIDAPLPKVWDKLAIQFDRAADWMSLIPKSVEKVDGVTVDDAPMVGRVCDLTTKPDGPYVDETIVAYDEERHAFTVKVVPVGGKLPIIQNLITFSLKDLGNNQTEMIWDSDIELKTVGKLLSPVLKKGLSKNLSEQMDELKYFVENNKPHPRKVAKKHFTKNDKPLTA